jgi:hypothetical protein
LIEWHRRRSLQSDNHKTGTTDWKIRDEWRDIDTRVFTPRIGLLRYIRNQQPQLRSREIELIASYLERSAKS